MTGSNNDGSSRGGRRLAHPEPQTAEAMRHRHNYNTGKIRATVYQEMGLGDSHAPEYGIPKLEPILDELNDKDLMALFVKLTRWADFFQAQVTNEEIAERSADAEVRKLEGLFMIEHKPARVSEAVTWVRAEMERDERIQTAREALRVVYARRKLKSMLFEQAERDAAVVSRELTRRTDTSMINRRADYRSP